MYFDLDVQEKIDADLGEPLVTEEDKELFAIAEKLKNKEIKMPSGWKIQVSDWTPLQLQYRDPPGYYPAGWISAALAWKSQNGGC